ncbi:MAG: N-acetylmuramoyl-L-alanine amidase [Paracoccaceae bacterium]|nr:MAG: N-acetylmuramoyl-L-alanine amidase [Paracoccaceae bacterium]
MTGIRAVLWGLAVWLALAHGGAAQDLSALARLEPARSAIAAAGDAVEVQLGITQPVPWRVRVLDGPPRLVLDTREVGWRGVLALRRAGPVTGLRAGPLRQGWSRLVMELDRPMVVDQAAMETGTGSVRILLRLVPADAATFAARAALPDPPGWALPRGVDLPAPPSRGTGPMIVVLDPGHGGIDPGAERDGLTEANLMLAFARELKEDLIREGGFSVVMTRDDDVFVPLETRISIARAAGAHVFVSLHADALAEGQATGATLYTLSEAASDRAAAALAERHDRDDLLSGVDLTGQDDLVAEVLMDMARTETRPRVDRLALAMETAIKARGLVMHRRPRQYGAFSVLKSPDIPSILIELGFLSSARDLKRLTDPDWRARMVASIRIGLTAWAAEDAALSALRD